jgi:hypothetical protein
MASADVDNKCAKPDRILPFEQVGLGDMTGPGGVSRQFDGDAARTVCRRKPPKVRLCQQTMRVRANVDRTTIQG